MTRVLVVDDEPQILRALRINLRVRGYEVDTAATGGQALEVAGHHPPDLVILDLGLPDLDGVEVIGAAKRVARLDGTDIRLTPTEWHLLEVLLRHPGKLLSQRQLLAEVWGPGYADATGNLRLYMTQLRRKLEPDPARPRWLRTEPGMGYRYQPDGDEQQARSASR